MLRDQKGYRGHQGTLGLLCGVGAVCRVSGVYLGVSGGVGGVRIYWG